MKMVYNTKIVVITLKIERKEQDVSKIRRCREKI